MKICGPGLVWQALPRLVKGNRENVRAQTRPYWTTMDKLEFIDWSEVQRRFGFGEIAIFQQRMMVPIFRPRIMITICLLY